MSTLSESVKGRNRGDVPHPIPYQGSKRNLAPVILSYFPQNFARLVEPFAGSAAVSLAAAQWGLTDRFWINDAHLPLIDLWREIIDYPERLGEKYSRLWRAQLGREREYYDVVRRKFNESHKPEYFLYLLARCVKAAIRYNGNGGFNNSPDNRRKGARPDTMRKRIAGASYLLQGRTELTACDFREVLARCGPSDLIYMDPPYQGVCGSRDNRYCPRIERQEFCAGLASLNEKGCRYIVSYDGRTGIKTYGESLPKRLRLLHIEVHAGRSTQATLLGRDCDTYESLYISPALAESVAAQSRKPAQLEFAL